MTLEVGAVLERGTHALGHDLDVAGQGDVAAQQRAEVAELTLNDPHNQA